MIPELLRSGGSDRVQRTVKKACGLPLSDRSCTASDFLFILHLTQGSLTFLLHLNLLESPGFRTLLDDSTKRPERQTALVALELHRYRIDVC